MAANKQDPRYFKYSPFPKRQCAVTGKVNANGRADFLLPAGNTVEIDVPSAQSPLVVTWANGFDPFPVDYAYKWTADVAPAAWGGFAAGTYYLYIDYDPATETVSYGKTTVIPNDDPIAPSHGSGVHWFDQSRYKMYESVSSNWVVRIRVFVGQCISNGSSVTSVISYAYNGAFIDLVATIPGVGVTTNWNHNIGSYHLDAFIGMFWISTNTVYRSIAEVYQADLNDFRWVSTLGIYDRLTLSHIRGYTKTFRLSTGGIITPILAPAEFRYHVYCKRSY